jgi:N-acetylmuramoyl-L-alanine amidase
MGITGYRKTILMIAVSVAIIAVMILSALYWWREGRWQYIIVHHTASSVGNLEYIKRIHIEERGWSDAAYHFVINNGSMGTKPGEIEISDRWKKRLWNTSTQNVRMNTYSIAVVLVGNFERRRIPFKQKQALINLLVNLSKEYDIPPERIIGHRDVNQTACPGRYVDLEEVRNLVRKSL